MLSTVPSKHLLLASSSQCKMFKNSKPLMGLVANFYNIIDTLNGVSHGNWQETEVVAIDRYCISLRMCHSRVSFNF